MDEREALLVRLEEVGGTRAAVADLPLGLLEGIVETAESLAATDMRAALAGDLIRAHGESEREACVGLDLAQLRARHATLMRGRPLKVDEELSRLAAWRPEGPVS